MKISEVPDKYRVYTLKLSNGREYIITGDKKLAIFASRSQIIELENGEGFNKAFIVNWEINWEETKKKVREHKPEFLNLLGS